MKFVQLSPTGSRPLPWPDDIDLRATTESAPGGRCRPRGHRRRPCHRRTGKGNDLTVRRLADSTAETLALSGDHHLGAPAHASLRFDGGRGPDRGAILQYVLYTEDGDHNPTSWSHALPTGVWQHVAIVNDGRRSIVWVDGSKIARNPTQPAHGIATLGRPFTLGATSYDLRYDQGFYGWIGDVRITARPLKPAEFLPAGHFA